MSSLEKKHLATCGECKAERFCSIWFVLSGKKCQPVKLTAWLEGYRIRVHWIPSLAYSLVQYWLGVSFGII
jgi:hypothetical protein